MGRRLFNDCFNPMNIRFSIWNEREEDNTFVTLDKDLTKCYFKKKYENAGIPDCNEGPFWDVIDSDISYCTIR
jgi:hypothetical protein